MIQVPKRRTRGRNGGRREIVKTTIWLLSILLPMGGSAQVPGNGVMGPQSGPEHTLRLRGQISSSILDGSWTVELAPNSHGIPEKVPVNPDGSFELHPLALGTYELSVFDGVGNLVYREPVHVTGSSQLLSIEPARSAVPAAGSAGSTVSVHQLQHKIPADALKAFTKAHLAANNGNQQEAIELMRRAVSIDPEYADAFNDLGALEVLRGQFQEAAEEFQKAIDIEPDHRFAVANLSIVLAKMKNFKEAGRVARKALQINPGDRQMRYILASSLLLENGDPTEVLNNLHQASPTIPSARLLAAYVLTHAGRHEEALEQLQEYLRAAPAGDSERPRVQAWIAQLEQLLQP